MNYAKGWFIYDLLSIIPYELAYIDYPEIDKTWFIKLSYFNDYFKFLKIPRMYNRF